MRTVVACFVLAAAIATPGIVVAATSSEAGSASPVFGLASGSATATPVSSGPINPALRPAVNAVRHALRAHGETNLETLSFGGTVQILQIPSGNQRCPVDVSFEIVQPQDMQLTLMGGCAHGSVDRGSLHVTYSPRSLGFVVREALATLPG